MNENQCPIGGGCPESTAEEIYAYRAANPKDYSEEEIKEAKVRARASSPFSDPIKYHDEPHTILAKLSSLMRLPRQNSNSPQNFTNTL
jgi:hypothetical protein